MAFPPCLVPPTLAAQQAATFQRFSDGRLLLNVVSGGGDSEQRRFGDWLNHDERYSRTGEFLKIVKSIWGSESFDFDGEYYKIRDGRVSEPPDCRSCGPKAFSRPRSRAAFRGDGRC